MPKIVCIVTGGIGDEIMSLPALRYLHAAFPDAEIEVRLGGWQLRHTLYSKLLGCPITLRPLDEIEHSEVTEFCDWLLHFDIRSLRGKAPARLSAKNGFYCFERDGIHRNAIIIRPRDSLFWQHCFEMAYRFVCRLKHQRFVRAEMSRIRDSFRVSTFSGTISPRIDAILSIASPRQIRIAVSPGGYNPAHKLWPIENFGKVICHAIDAGLTVFVLGSTKELELAQKLLAYIQERPQSWRDAAPGCLSFVYGRLELEELPDFLQTMSLHLSNDNGVAQIGGALNLPQIILYRGTASPHRSLGNRDVPLYSGDYWSMTNISVSDVIQALEKMLRPHDAV